MKHKGLRTHRFADNPEERLFAKAWNKLNDRGNVLAHMLDDRPVQGGRPPEPADRDAEVAATVVQWLGSPVGQSFLRECGWTKGGAK